MIQSTSFWRKYCSDLGRTQHTAQLITPSDTEHLVEWILDARLREIAKGARQEYPKYWDFERAVEERRRLDKEMPLLESSEDAWKRIADFMADVLMEAGQEYANVSSISTPITLSVLVISHAGTLRTMLQKMVPFADPTLQYQDDPSHPPDDGNRLDVPNTSVTVLDVTPSAQFWNLQGLPSNSRAINDRNRERLGPNDAFFPPPGTTGDDDGASNNAMTDIAAVKLAELWDTKIVEFMWTKHLDKAVTTSNDE
jgi:broad specificity phosphatase PhoE